MIEDVITSSGKPTAQVMNEARKFCELNETPKTLKVIETFYNKASEHIKTCKEKKESTTEYLKFVFELYTEDAFWVSGEKRLPDYVIDELLEVLTYGVHNKI